MFQVRSSQSRLSWKISEQITEQIGEIEFWESLPTLGFSWRLLPFKFTAERIKSMNLTFPLSCSSIFLEEHLNEAKVCLSFLRLVEYYQKFFAKAFFTSSELSFATAIGKAFRRYLERKENLILQKTTTPRKYHTFLTISFALESENDENSKNFISTKR